MEGEWGNYCTFKLQISSKYCYHANFYDLEYHTYGHIRTIQYTVIISVFYESIKCYLSNFEVLSFLWATTKLINGEKLIVN